MKIFIATALLTSMVGALSPAFAAAQGTDVTYRCDGRKAITVTYTGDNGDVAVFEDGGESIMLEQVPSGSGVLYRASDPNYTYELATKGKTATFYSAPDKPFLTNCTEQ